MRKDIHLPVVEDIAIAVIKEEDGNGDAQWNVYLLNLKESAIEGVLVSSRGYGVKNGEKVQTSTLRHFLDVVPAKTFVKIEPIMEELFALGNEFWVSFYLDQAMYDKKYVFVAETIKEENFTLVPLINKRGVMIR